MVLQIELDRNGLGRNAFKVATPYEVLGYWLTSDVATATVGQRWLDVINAVVTGTEPSAEGTGNSFTIFVGRDSSRIECEYVEEQTLDLPTALVVESLERFIEFQRSREKG